METAEYIKALVQSHADGDDTRFYAIAIQVAAQAARSGHGKFAEELRDLVDKVKASRSVLAVPWCAAMLILMEKYVATGYDYRLSLVELQKFAYFLQEAGEPLQLKFETHYCGPYSDTLYGVLLNIGGPYILGLRDGLNAPEAPLALLSGATEAAEDLLVGQPATSECLKRVARLIEGFETPFGMEVLGTVHRIAILSKKAADLDNVVRRVRFFNSAKRQSQMKDGHIRAAWLRLKKQGWL